MPPLKITLAQRHLELIAKIKTERQQFGQHHNELRESLGYTEIGMQIIGKLKQKPLLITAIAAGIFLIKPRRLLSFAGSCLSTWQIWQSLSPMLTGLWANSRSEEQ